MVQSQEITLSVLLPVRNEALSIEVMLKLLKTFIEVPHEVLVICDSKEDNSIDVVENHMKKYDNLKLVLNQKGRGVANAIAAGYEASRGQNILIFAADDVGPVFVINEMLSLMKDGCDFVSCTRYAHGGRRLGGSLIGGILSQVANMLFRIFSGCILTDATTGIKMMKREIFPKLHLGSRSVGWSIAFEMAIKAQLEGFNLGEVPLISIDRIFGGESSFRLIPWVVGYSRWFLWGTAQLRSMKKKEGVLQNKVVTRLPGELARNSIT